MNAKSLFVKDPDNPLRLNPTKIEVLQLGGGDSCFGNQLLALDGVPLIPASTIKSLGVILDATLQRPPD